MVNNKEEIKFEEIYARMQEHVFSSNSFFGRRLIVVPYSAFKREQPQFNQSYNYFNNKDNFRTGQYFKHIHAIRTGGVIEFHYDYSNPDKGIFFAFVHLWVDMVPYFFWRMLTWQKPYKI